MPLEFMNGRTHMASRSKVTLAQAQVIAEAVQLDLPQDRLDSLAEAYSDFLEGFEEARAIDTGDREPATFVPSKEEQS